MTARLVFLTGSRAGTAYDLREEDESIGRKSDRTIIFGSEDVLVSAMHATLLYRDGQYILRDDGSRNATFVNAEKITERVLQDGDLVQFGAGGPGARFILRAAIEASPTLDPQDLAEAAEILRRTKPAENSMSTASRALTTTREMVVMVVKRSKRTRRWLIAVAAATISAIAAIVIVQQRARANLENTMSDLSVSLAAERASRSELDGVCGCRPLVWV